MTITFKNADKNTIDVPIPKATHASLMKFAALSDDPTNIGAVVTKLVKLVGEYLHNDTPSQPEPPPTDFKEFGQAWRSPRGDFFPIGRQLRAQYLGKVYLAEVTIKGIDFAGKTYDSPSAAAIAVKESTGKSGSAANTNGWEFWEMLEPKTGQWGSIAKLKVGKQ